MINQTNLSNPEILWNFSVVHSLVDLDNLEELINCENSNMYDFSYENINIDTYFAINYIIQKVENIYQNDKNIINISVKKAIKTVLLQLRKSINIWEKLLYQKIKIHQLDKKIIKLKKETDTDPLTCLLNRRGIAKEFKKIIALKNRNYLDSSILIIDIDHFKIINDNFWHDIWDKALIDISNIFKEEVRWSDVVWRLWWEEFIIIMYWTNIEWAIEKANEIRRKIQHNLWYNIKEINHEITISIWVSQTKIEDETCKDIIKRADNALIYAKNNGRNCVQYEI